MHKNKNGNLCNCDKVTKQTEKLLKKQKKKCMEGYHKQKLPSQNLYEVLRYIDSHDSSMVKRMAKKSRLEHLFEQVEQEA